MLKQFYVLAFAASVGLVTVGCDVDQTREGELPDVDVQVDGEPGQMPEYDVDGPEVDVSTETKEVQVPDVDVDTETSEVQVPDVDVSLPDEDN